MPPLSSTIFYLLGTLTTLNGASALLSPSLAAKNAQILDISLPAVHAIALGALSIGALFIRAAQRNDKNVMYLSVVGRVLAVMVFWGDGGKWRNVAVYEGGCGVLVVGALGWEGWVGRGGRGGRR